MNRAAMRGRGISGWAYKIFRVADAPFPRNNTVFLENFAEYNENNENSHSPPFSKMAATSARFLSLTPWKFVTYTPLRTF
jgi:hypothetical protein